MTTETPIPQHIRHIHIGDSGYTDSTKTPVHVTSALYFDGQPVERHLEFHRDVEALHEMTGWEIHLSGSTMRETRMTLWVGVGDIAIDRDDTDRITDVRICGHHVLVPTCAPLPETDGLDPRTPVQVTIMVPRLTTGPIPE